MHIICFSSLYSTKRFNRAVVMEICNTLYRLRMRIKDVCGELSQADAVIEILP